MCEEGTFNLGTQGHALEELCCQNHQGDVIESPEFLRNHFTFAKRIWSQEDSLVVKQLAAQV